MKVLWRIQTSEKVEGVGGWGGGVGEWGLKKNFSALRASVFSKNKGRGLGPPGPYPGSATEVITK